MIYHVTTSKEWASAEEKGFFEAPSLHSEGFIHMSTINQVEGVLSRYYKNIPDLVLLHVEESALIAELKYELSPSMNQEFPHIFGPINLNAVVKVEPV